MATELTLSNGVSVVPGKIAVSSFLKEAVEKTGGNRKFSGTFEDLEDLTAASMDHWKPGLGAVDGDVRIVEVPTAGFSTEIVRITDENSHLLEVVYNPRREGEEAVPTLILRGIDPVEAATVGIVIYRADVLERDSGRSSDAEWEIVAILADPELPEGASVPMNPATMARNAAHLEGGTLREYTAEQWLEATLFWQRHARVAPALERNIRQQIAEILIQGGFQGELDHRVDGAQEAAAQIELLFEASLPADHAKQVFYSGFHRKLVDILYGGSFRSWYIPEYQADFVDDAASQIEDILRANPGSVEIP